ncbi:hypothetical protein J6590_049243 [Homalodisca vitripennis]|nr:hypothetical protein J6590_049243 [Homalodisca vitripennis]
MQTTRVMYAGPSGEISVDLTNKQYSVLQLSDSELQPLARSGPSEEISVDLTNKQYSVLQLSDSELQPLARSGPSEEISVDLTNKQYSVLQLSDSELQPLARSADSLPPDSADGYVLAVSHTLIRDAFSQLNRENINGDKLRKTGTIGSTTMIDQKNILCDVGQHLNEYTKTKHLD